MTARLTPYELILQPLETTAFPAIREEGERRGTDTRRRDQFVLLGGVGAALKEMIADDAPADAIEQYADLLFHGYQFWEFGRRLYVLGDEVTRRLTEPALDLGDWTLAAPPACYLQLPYQRLWARVEADAPYEPADGCFVVVDDTEPAPDAGAHLRVLLVLGLREERPGISLVSYRTDLKPASAPALAARPWRADAEPFAAAIPGAERRDYRAIATTSELQALVLRALWYLDRHPRALVAREGSAEPGESALPHVEARSEGQ